MQLLFERQTLTWNFLNNNSAANKNTTLDVSSCQKKFMDVLFQRCVKLLFIESFSINNFSVSSDLSSSEI